MKSNSKIKKIIGVSFLLILSYVAINLFTYSTVNEVSLGCIKISKNLYFYECEVTVREWVSYYSWILKQEGSIAANKILPDSVAVESEVWQLFKHKSNRYDKTLASETGQPIGFFCKKCDDFIKYDKDIYRRSACPFYYFPITGLTYEQVVEFCKWKTKVQGGNKIVYSLPTQQQWIDIAVFCLGESMKKRGFQDSITKKGCPTFNYKFHCACLENPKITKSQQLGIGGWEPCPNAGFDIFGNVSEMTADKGIAKGGNYLTFANQCHYDSIQVYKKPEIWLGFRYIARLNGN